jgi:hypothetical protein
MAARRPQWKKYVRVGGFLLVLFAPVLGIFLVKSLALLPKRAEVSVTMTGEPMPMMEHQGGMMDGMDKMWRAEGDMAPMAMDAMTMPMMTGATSVAVADRKMAKSASLELRAQSLQETMAKIQDTVKNVGGYVESANVSQPMNGIKTAWLSVRVPTDRLEATLDEAKKAASAVVSENLNAGDVTDQNIDLAARLNAKRAEEAALVSLLDTATKVSDVIEITGRLSMVRAEIEQMESQSRMLEGQVAMASISMSVTEDPQVIVDTTPVRDGNVVKQSVTDLSRWGIALGSALVALTISGLPVVIIYGFFIWVLFRFGRFVASRVVTRKK